MECTRCGGRDDNCPDCDGRGRIRITSCPRKMIDRQTLRVIEHASLAEKGLWPVAGGALDQSHSAADAFRFIWSEESYWKAKRSK